MTREELKSVIAFCRKKNDWSYLILEIRNHFLAKKKEKQYNIFEKMTLELLKGVQKK